MNSILSEDAARVPLALRRIARAYLDQRHLRAGSGVPTTEAGTAIRRAREAAAEKAADDAWLRIEWPGPLGSVVQGDWRLLLGLIEHGRAADGSAGVAVYEDARLLGAARMAVQFPLLAGEPDVRVADDPPYTGAERKALERMRDDAAARRQVNVTLPNDLVYRVDRAAKAAGRRRGEEIEAALSAAYP